MSVEVIYTKKGCNPVRMLINDGDVWALCAWTEKRMFPGADVKAQNAAADRAVARHKKAK